MNVWITFGKFLGTPGVRRNGAPSSHIHGGPHHDFNECIPQWMWEEGAPFCILRKYLRITHYFFMICDISIYKSHVIKIVISQYQLYVLSIYLFIFIRGKDVSLSIDMSSIIKRKKEKKVM